MTPLDFPLDMFEITLNAEDTGILLLQLLYMNHMNFFLCHPIPPLCLPSHPAGRLDRLPNFKISLQAIADDHVKPNGAIYIYTGVIAIELSSEHICIELPG